jgi:hypothetical protein
VTKEQQRVREEEQRVIDDTPILTIPRITNAPPIMQAHNHCKKGLEEYATHTSATNKGKYTGCCTNDCAYPSHPTH